MFQSRHFKLATCSVISYHNLINRRFLRKLARCVTLESGECDKRARRICDLAPFRRARELPKRILELGVTAVFRAPLDCRRHHVRACV